MYKEKVRKFKCYYCSDCKLYAGSETKTIHGRRMKPNTKYCTGGKKVIIFRSDDPKVNVPKWCPKAARFEQGKTQQHRISHASPDRPDGVAVGGDTLDQHRIDGDTD